MKRSVIKTALEAHKKQLEEQLAELNDALKEFSVEDSPSLGNNEIAQEGKDPKYDKSWGLATKFQYLLSRECRFLHFREAGQLIANIEGGGDPKELSGKISSACQFLKKNGTLVKYQATKNFQDTFWGSPKWLTDDGKVKEGHEINKEYLFKKGSRKPNFNI